MKILLHTLICCISLAVMRSFAMESVDVAQVVEQQSRSEHIKALIRMARLAQHAYKNPEIPSTQQGIQDNSALIENDAHLKELLAFAGIEYIGTVTQGRNHQIRIVAFYNKESGTILYAVRGTVPSNFTNLLADLGIGRLKTNEDLLESLATAKKNLHEHGLISYQNSAPLFGVLETLIGSRVTSSNTYMRILEPWYRGNAKGFRTGFSTFAQIFKKPLSSIPSKATAAVSLGGGVATTAAGATVTVASGTSLAAGGLALLTTAVGTAAFVSLLNGMYEGTKETIKGYLTINDGFEHLLDHVKLLKSALDQINAFAASKGLEIKNTCWIGHSLGGFLAMFGALLTNGTACTFNAPGLRLQEAALLASQAGIVAQEHILAQEETVDDRILHIRNRTCTIGLLGQRDGAILHFCRHEHKGDDCERHLDLRLESIILQEHGIETLIETLEKELDRLQLKQ